MNRKYIVGRSETGRITMIVRKTYSDDGILLEELPLI